MQPRRIPGLVWTILVLLGLGLAWWVGRAPAPSGTLRDGTRLTLRQLDVGTNSVLRVGGPVRRVAARLPMAVARRWGRAGERTVSFGDTTNLVLWLTGLPQGVPLKPDPTPTGLTQSGWWPERELPTYRVVDDFGTNLVRMMAMPPMRLLGDEVVTCLHAELWPRRSRYFTLQAWSRDGATSGRPEWELRVRNPAFANYSQWAPERLPAPRSVGDTKFTLHELQPAPSPNLPPDAFPPALIRVDATCAGEPCDDWQICGVQCRDATGNRIQAMPAETIPAGRGRWWVRVPIVAFAGEDTARIGVGFVPYRRVATNDLFVLRGVSLRTPSSGGAGGPGLVQHPVLGRVYVGANRAFDGETHQVFVASGEPMPRKVWDPDARWLFVAGATDERGRAATLGGQGFDGVASRWLTLPGADSEVLDITVAAPRVVFLEWTVSCARLRLAGAGAPP